MPAKPRWLLAIPDAIRQFEELDWQLLTRRDIERLFGIGKARAAALMKTFGAELVGNQRTFPRTKLLPQLKKHRGRAAFRHEEERRERLFAELRQARLTGIHSEAARRVPQRGAGEPAGRRESRARPVEVRFDGAEDALVRLYTLAQALGKGLGSDLGRFQALVGR